MSFKDNLQSILDDMSKYHRDKDKLLIFYINERLNASLSTYYKELSTSMSYLSDKNNMRVLKTMNKD